MRDLKELYTILKDSLKQGKKTGYFNYGLCGEMKDLRRYKIITDDEYDLLTNHLRSQEPILGGKYDNFAKSPMKSHGSWWWEPMDSPRHGERTRNIRILFILAVIKDLK